MPKDDRFYILQSIFLLHKLYTQHFLAFHVHQTDLSESTNLKKNRIYIRRGTSCEEATSEEITDIIKRRMNAEYPDSGKTLNLDEHLEQLKTLYSKISPTNEYYQGGIGNSLLKLTEVIKAVSAGEWISEDNPLYPEEDYEEFIARMIDEKKWKIERELDLI